MPPALVPGPDLIDGRTLPEKLRWAEGFAKAVTYFDSDGTIRPPTDDDAPWAAFLQNDVAFLLAEVAATTHRLHYQHFARDTPMLRERAETHIGQIIGWWQKADQLALLAASDSIEANLRGVLESALKNELEGSMPMSYSPSGMLLKDGPLSKVFSEDAVEDEGILFSLVVRVIRQLAARSEMLLQEALNIKSDHAPQIGLLIAFFEMQGQVQTAMNGIAERHLDYYYNTVLRLKPHAVQKDKADLVFEIAPKSAGQLVPSGTCIVAASGAGSERVVFETCADLQVDPVTVADQRALWVTRKPPLPGRNQSWVTGIRGYTLLNEPSEHTASTHDPWPWISDGQHSRVPDPKIGFAISSPTLNAASGERQIDLSLSFSDKDGWSVKEALARFDEQLVNTLGGIDLAPDPLVYLAGALCVEITQGDAGLSRLRAVTVGVDTASNGLLLQVTVPADAAPIAADPKDLNIPHQPYMRISFDPIAPVFALSMFEGARVMEAGLSVRVTGSRDVQLSTSSGPVDASKPFAPFGNMAHAGSTLFVDAPPLRDVALTWAEISLQWSGLPKPPDTIASHYKGYDAPIKAEDFTVALEIARGNDWKPMWPEDAKLFDVAKEKPDTLCDVSSFSAAVPLGPEHQKPASRLPALRLRLTAPEAGFGQSLYPQALTAHALDVLKQTKGFSIFGVQVGGSDTPVPPPNPPLPLLTEDLRLNYTTHVQASLADPEGGLDFFSLTPLGQTVPASDGMVVDRRYDLDAIYMIGLAGTPSPHAITLYFNIDTEQDRSIDTFQAGRFPTVEWAYFDGSAWRLLDAASVIKDSTLGLSRAGIVELSLPTTLQPGPSYPGGLRWIAAQLSGDLERLSRLNAVHTNAVEAARLSDQREPSLPAGLLSRLETPRPGIKSILQPRPSYGGRPEEDSFRFRRRVAERLSHRGRAILPRDYGRLIMEAYPDVSQVSVLPCEAGRLELVVVPPRATGKPVPGHLPHWKLKHISNWLEKRTGLEPGTINLRGPSYEPVRISARFLLWPDAPADVLMLAKQTIVRTIAPWKGQPTTPLPIGHATLDTATLLAALQDVDGIRGVTGLAASQMYRDASGAHRIKDTARSKKLRNRQVLHASGLASVLVPSADHDFGFLPDRHGIGDLAVDRDFFLASEETQASYQTGLSLIPVRPRAFGLGQMTIGQSLILSEPEDTQIFTGSNKMRESAPSIAIPEFHAEGSLP